MCHVPLSISWLQFTKELIHRSDASFHTRIFAVTVYGYVYQKLCVFKGFSEFISLRFVFKQNQGLRESDFRSFWLSRNHRILDWLIHESSSIMCLQVEICLLPHFWLERRLFFCMKIMSSIIISHLSRNTAFPNGSHSTIFSLSLSLGFHL